MHQLPCESCITETQRVYVSKQEDHFVETNTESKNGCQKKIAIFIIIFIVLIAAIIGCIILVLNQKPVNFNNNKTNNSTQNQRVTFDELIKNPFVLPKSFHFTNWLSDSQFFIQNENEDLILFTINDSQIEGTAPKLLLNRNQISNAQIQLNSDSSLVTFLKENERSYPISEFGCEIAKLNDIAGTRRNLMLKNKTIGDIQVFQWNPAPNSSDFVFVYQNDIYYQKFNESENTIQVTHSDSPFVYYGVGDWMIREEILDNSIWWSQSGRYIAYASYDGRNVSKVAVNFQSKSYNLSYPRPGDEYLHGVWLFIWDKVEQTRQFALPDDNLVHDSQTAIQYLLSAAWTQFDGLGEVLLSIWSNRVQNAISITLCPINEQCFQFFKFKYNINGKALWVEPPTLKLKYFSSNGFFIILPQLNQNGNTYDNIAYIEIIQNKQENVIRHKLQMLSFGFDVEAIVGYDKEKDEIFFTGQGGLIGEKHLFRISNATKLNNKIVEPQCITCPIKDCNFVDPLFSANSKRMLINCESPYHISQIYLKSNADIMKNYMIQPNKQKVDPKLRNSLPTLKFETIKLSHGLDATVEFVLPSNFNSNLKYPVLLSIYAGPSVSNSVEKRSPSYLETYFVEAHSIVVIKVDARGSSLRGWNLKQQLYRHLGGPEIEDQMETLRILLERYPFLDSKRVTLSGWSYGGFATLHISQIDSNRLIKCAIAGGSVTDFRNYDSAYTERYMGLLKENKIGYVDSSVLMPDKLAVFRRIKLLVIHGLSDENVIFDWNTGQLIRQLQLYNYNFTQILYPNERHSLGEVKRHFITQLERFLLNNCFN